MLMNEVEAMYIRDIVAMDPTDIKIEERDDIISALQDHMIKSVEDAYKYYSTIEENSIVCRYEEKDLELLVSRKNKESWMLGIRSKTALEYISCSETSMDFCYTIKGKNENERGLVYNYRDHPSMVFKNALRLFSLFHQFFSETEV